MHQIVRFCTGFAHKSVHANLLSPLLTHPLHASICSVSSCTADPLHGRPADNFANVLEYDRRKITYEYETKSNDNKEKTKSCPLHSSPTLPQPPTPKPAPVAAPASMSKLPGVKKTSLVTQISASH